MKVILLEDVRKLGKKGDKIVVSDGYGANYLIPNKLAVLETTKASNELERQKEEERIAEENAKIKAQEVAELLKDVVLEFDAPSSKDGRMFGTISPKQIEEELKNNKGIIIDKRKFIDKYPVNAFGYSRLRIELHKGVVATINVHVNVKEK